MPKKKAEKKRKKEPFVDHILSGSPSDTPLAEYAASPASALLKQIVHVCDSVNHCIRLFTKKSDGAYTKDSQDSLFRLGAAALASIMSHVETFQRHLVAGLFEITRHIPKHDMAKCCKELGKDLSLQVSVERLAAFRGRETSVGLLLADAITGWHDPGKVNKVILILVPGVNFYGNDDIEALRILWQIRHSIVHTAGWLTPPDADKVAALAKLADKPLLLKHTFTENVVRKMHRLVKASMGRLEAKVKGLLPGGLPTPAGKEVRGMFKVESPRSSWF